MAKERDPGHGDPRDDGGTGDRSSALVLGVSESLDLDIVLPEIADGACGLTGARRAIVATVATVNEFGVPGTHVFLGLTL